MTLPSFNARDVRVLAIGFLTLFLELAFIRWMPSNVFVLAYFANTVLIASFLGLGLGYLLVHRRYDFFYWFPVCVLIVGVISTLFRFVFVFLVPTSTDILWNMLYVDNWFRYITIRMGMWQVLTAVFVLSAAPFILLGQKAAKLMDGMTPLRAYGLHSAGSILGVVAFTGMAFVGGAFGGPTAWFFVVFLTSLMFVYERRFALVAGVLCMIAFPVYLRQLPDPETWSPYYAINTYTNTDQQTTGIYVNRFLHQTMYNVEENPLAQRGFSVPYLLKPAKRVLVLGAGSGNDVAAALLYGAEHVDAVELDPVIAGLGKAGHPNRPYADPRVTLTIGDARAFLQQSTETYDTIVFGTLDSHVLVSGMSTARMESFVYTKEAFQAAKDHLSPDGTVAILFSVPEQWLADKIMKTALEVFQDPHPVVYAGGDAPVLFNLALIAGPGLATVSSNQLLANSFRVIAGSTVDDDAVPTDDWPYLYLASRSIPIHYVKALGILLLMSLVGIYAVSGGRMQHWGAWSNARYFFLGAAFLLLETVSVTKLSLVYSATWLVNAFVFGGILTMMCCATFALSRRRIRDIRPWYLGLMLAVFVNFLTPASVYLGMSDIPRFILPGLVTALPIFFSATIFSFHFSTEERLGERLGANLLGAVFGGFLEYLSMITGFRLLYVCIAALYGLAYVAHTKSMQEASQPETL